MPPPWASWASWLHLLVLLTSPTHAPRRPSVPTPTPPRICAHMCVPLWCTARRNTPTPSYTTPHFLSYRGERAANERRFDRWRSTVLGRPKRLTRASPAPLRSSGRGAAVCDDTDDADDADDAVASRRARARALVFASSSLSAVQRWNDDGGTVVVDRDISRPRAAISMRGAASFPLEAAAVATSTFAAVRLRETGRRAGPTNSRRRATWRRAARRLRPSTKGAPQSGTSYEPVAVDAESDADTGNGVRFDCSDGGGCCAMRRHSRWWLAFQWSS